MKKNYLLILTALLAFGVVTFYACKKVTEEPFEEVITTFRAPAWPTDIVVANVTDPITGTYTMAISGADGETSFLAQADSLGYDSAFFLSQSIMDSVFLMDTCEAYYVIQGSAYSGGLEHKVTIGLDVVKDYNGDTYFLKEGTGGGWSCVGKCCSKCNPTRNGGKWYAAVNGCKCNQVEPNCSEGQSRCTHSSTGGVDWLKIIGILVGVLV